MPLDHAEAVYGSDAHRELHPDENKHSEQVWKEQKEQREASFTDVLHSLTLHPLCTVWGMLVWTGTAQNALRWRPHLHRLPRYPQELNPETQSCYCWYLQQTENNCLLGWRRSKVKSSLTAIGRFGDLKQNRPSLQVSDFKTGEVHVVDIVFRFAEIICNTTEQIQFLLLIYQDCFSESLRQRILRPPSCCGQLHGVRLHYCWKNTTIRGFSTRPYRMCFHSSRSRCAAPSR